MADLRKAFESSMRVVGGRSTQYASGEWLDGEIRAASVGWRGADTELRQNREWHGFVLTTQGGTALTGARINGEFYYEGADGPGALSYTPAGTDRHSWYVGADLRFFGLYVHDRTIQRLGLRALLREAPPIVNGSDQVLQVLLTSLAADLESGVPLSAAYLEQAIGLVVARASRISAGQEVERRSLGRRVIQQVAEYVDAHLGEDLSVSDLALIAGISTDSFGQHFKTSTGKTPYRFIVERRVHRAEQLLTETDLDLSSIALRVGFSSHSHLTTTFKKIRGQTPTSVRRKAQGL